jgi:CheY-like chemotaxis protein
MTGQDIGELRGKVLAILGEVLGDERAERVFALALSNSPAASLRDDYSLCVFVGGPLYGAVSNEAGKELADHLMQRMRPLMDRVLAGKSGVWRDLNPVMVSAGEAMVVLLATAEVDLGVEIETALTTRGHAVVGAFNGLQALERCRTCRPDVVLADAELPGKLTAQRLIELMQLALGLNAPPVIVLAPSDYASEDLPCWHKNGAIADLVNLVEGEGGRATIPPPVKLPALG